MRVTDIIDPEYKTGKSDKGKPWTLAKVRVENGKEATGFQPVKINDEVELTYNSDYHNYSFKLVDGVFSVDINDDISGSGDDAPKTSPSPTIKEPSQVSTSTKMAAAEPKFLKDTTDIPYRVWKDLLPYVDVQSLWTDSDYNRQVNEYVMEQANELLTMIDKVRNDDKAEN